MHKRNLINELETTFPKSMGRKYPDGVIEAGVEIILNTIRRSLVGGRRIELRSLGVFNIRLDHPKVTRNPRTGETIYKGYREKVRFKPCKNLLEFLNEEVDESPAIEPYKIRKAIKEKLRDCKDMIRKEYELRKKK